MGSHSYDLYRYHRLWYVLERIFSSVLRSSLTYYVGAGLYSFFKVSYIFPPIPTSCSRAVIELRPGLLEELRLPVTDAQR